MSSAPSTSGNAPPRSGRHLPVLLREVLELLDPKAGETAVDCTAGLGGHASAIAERLGPTGTLVLFDLDPSNLASANERVRAMANPPRTIPVHASFHEAGRRLLELGLRADVLLADLGFSSNQVDSPERGLAFKREGPLDMRLDPTSPITASELVNTLSTRELARILKEFGEERFAGSIAENIVRARENEPITTTSRLAEIARGVVASKQPYSHGSIDGATRTFQALRIAVNDELGRLGSLLESIERGSRAVAKEAAGNAGSQGASWLATGARVGVIAFHSLEDRPVKRCFGSLVEEGLAVGLTRKPVEAGQDEVAVNPRSRSAKLRVCRIGA